jgi:hypothetical protein
MNVYRQALRCTFVRSEKSKKWRSLRKLKKSRGDKGRCELRINKGRENVDEVKSG